MRASPRDSAMLPPRGGVGGGVALSHGYCEAIFRSPSYMPPPAALGSTRESAIPPPPPPAWAESRAITIQDGVEDFALALVATREVR